MSTSNTTQSLNSGIARLRQQMEGLAGDRAPDAVSSATTAGAERLSPVLQLILGNAPMLMDAGAYLWRRRRGGDSQARRALPPPQVKYRKGSYMRPLLAVGLVLGAAYWLTRTPVRR